MVRAPRAARLRAASATTTARGRSGATSSTSRSSWERGDEAPRTARTRGGPARGTVAALLTLPQSSAGDRLRRRRGPRRGRGGYEVWAVDQSDTTAARRRHALRLRRQDARRPLAEQAAREAETIDLGGAAQALCLAQHGQRPACGRTCSSSTAARTHGVLAYVASGHVLFFDAAHAGAGRVHRRRRAGARRRTRSRTSSYVIVANLARQAAAPDRDRLRRPARSRSSRRRRSTSRPARRRAARCARTRRSGRTTRRSARSSSRASRFAFVTLRGGGLFVLDARATPMAIVGEYDRQTIDPNGCGGIEAAGKMYVNSGGGWPANPTESDLYAFPLAGSRRTPNTPNTPAPEPRLQPGRRTRRSSTRTARCSTERGRYLWVADRAANKIVSSTRATRHGRNEIALAGGFSGDPAPDLLGISPSGDAGLRLAARPDAADGQRPARRQRRRRDAGRRRAPGEGRRRARRAPGDRPIGNVVDGVERADPHGLRVREMTP